MDTVKMVSGIESYFAPGMSVGSFILFLCALAFIGFIYIRYHGDFMTGLKGVNSVWDVPEIVVFWWTILFIVAAMADIFFNLTASDQLWYAFDLILLFAIGGRTAIEIAGKKPRSNLTKDDNNV